ncbi:ester cyclase [Ktedonosporobacter rubrisoli]|uniref:Ester cyclase n=1 Tax=Ktedonosporobacter rubrisoli TaxID=2509675 RepID=A0A4P6JJR1_KTERU|nr:ester cyclase [Ktedonosporobacter rubrisoli]QBD75365.1 ester cyclase [Ktedonosporobacter rubrisoli]
MALNEKKQLIYRYFEEMWNAWNFQIADEIIAEKIVFQGSLGVTTSGREGLKQYMRTVQTAFPDWYNKIEELIMEDDKLCALMTYTGTHKGPLFGLEPTGKQIKYAGTAFFRIEKQQIVYGWVLGDRLNLWQQLGAIPQPVPGPQSS